MGKLGPATKRCSIVIVTYNSEKEIGECLTSVISAMSPDDELIVWDNASADGTVVLLKGFADKETRLNVMESE